MSLRYVRFAFFARSSQLANEQIQLEKFKAAARDAECDESESHWDERLKRVVTHKPKGEPKPE